MKVEITLRTTNKVINALAKVMEPTLERISTQHSVIVFETEDPEGWLSEGRKEAFEKKYNEDIGGGDIHYIVEKIAVTN